MKENMQFLAFCAWLTILLLLYISISNIIQPTNHKVIYLYWIENKNVIAFKYFLKKYLKILLQYLFGYWPIHFIVSLNILFLCVNLDRKRSSNALPHRIVARVYNNFLYTLEDLPEWSSKWFKRLVYWFLKNI
jgi:hypothetical protein